MGKHARIDLSHALAVATEAAREAGALLRAEFHRTGGPRHEGRHHADVDDELEAIIRERLTAAFPECGYVGEETQPALASRNGLTWYVDPNDGTKAFLEGWRGSAVSIGLVDGALPVLGVVFAPVAPDDAGDLVTWAEGEPLRRNGAVVTRSPLPSRLGRERVVLVSQDADRNSEANAAVCDPARFRAVPSIAYRLALVAVGEGDAGVSLNGPVAWDYAGGHALLRGVGGELVDARGAPIRYDAPGSGGGAVFGGQLEVARALAERRWGQVFEKTPETKGISTTYPLVRPDGGERLADPGLLARAQGCLLGQFAGDALGSLVEFRTAADIRREYPDGVRALADGGTWNTIAGQPTDDSELALMLARSLVKEGHFEANAVRAAYVAWLHSHAFDIGGTTRAGLSGRPDDGSQANGSLMRVSPLGIFGHALAADTLARLAREDAAITHPNPVCQDATALFVFAIAHAIRKGAGRQDVFEATLAQARSTGVASVLIDTLEGARTHAPREFQKQQGWVLIAFQNAFFQLLHAPSLEAGVVDTVGRGGDTDTNGAIAGALLGAVHGRDAVPLPWRRAILACRPIGTAKARPRAFWPVDALELAEALVVRGARSA